MHLCIIYVHHRLAVYILVFQIFRFVELQSCVYRLVKALRLSVRLPVIHSSCYVFNT